MSYLKSKYWVVLGIGILLLYFSGCNNGAPSEGDTDSGNNTDTGNNNDTSAVGDTDFQSADPSYDYGDADSDSDSDSDGDSDSDADADDEVTEEEDDPEREIEEADIVKIVDNTLYALSRYRGLVTIDISDPTNLQILDRYNVYGIPFEMYVRDGVALAMYSSFYEFVYNDETHSYEYQISSRVIALDTVDPTNIMEIDSFEIPGQINDSRIVGDVLYAVAFQNGYCYQCDNTPKTSIMSLNLSNLDDIVVADRLDYEEPDSYYGWRRSIEVTTERMYVSGISYDGTNSEQHSTIQLVDISDPQGQLTAGASVEVAGQIESRWQMNEHDGVLRVISQPGSAWGSGVQPVVETFTIVSNDQVEPLGELEMILPRPENLMSVRFDGTRAYAVTFERTDPLFVFDLSDPSQPVQQGELEIPGWLYHMEPRGDRLFAIGYDEVTDEGRRLAISLFDVADPENPTMLDRVTFGADWGWMPEDQDRIHKAFKILKDEELILMPYAGWSRDDNGYYGSYHSGIQLVDFTTDNLILRGIAPHNGRARRAFLHDGYLFAMSDERVESFDIYNRDAPELLSSVKLSRLVYRTAPVGDYVAELVGDWWTQEATLALFPMTDPDAFEPIGQVDLSSLKPENSSTYYYWRQNFNFYSPRMFSHGNYVYMLWSEYTGYYIFDDGYVEGEYQTGVAIIDISEPSEPSLIAKHLLPFGFLQYYYYGDATVRSGNSILQNGSTFTTLVDNAHIVTFDLTNPSTPVISDPVPLPAANQRFSLIDGDGVVALSHFEQVEEQSGRVKFYLDRLDISNPDQPKWLPKINIPGSPIYYSESTGKLITMDYQTEATAVDSWGECNDLGPYGTIEYNEETGLCYQLAYDLILASVKDDKATVTDTLDFQNLQMSQAVATENAIYLSSMYSYWWDSGTNVDPRAKLITVSIGNDGQFQSFKNWTIPSRYCNLMAADDEGALLVANYPPTAHLIEQDTSGSFTQTDILINGGTYEAHLTKDRLIFANGMWGVQTFER